LNQDILAPAAHTASLKICPKCGHTGPADARVCKLCLRNIQDVPAITGTAAEERLASDEVEARERSRLLLRRRWRIIVMSTIAFVVGLFAVTDNAPSPIVGTGVRSMESTAAATWSGASGGPQGNRATTAAAPLLATETWTVSFDSAVVGISADAERVYVALEDSLLVVLDALTGDEVWSRPVPGRLEEPPTIAGDRVYISQRNSRVIAADAATGEEIWAVMSPDLGFLSSSAVVQDGLVWIAGQQAVFVLDAESGLLLATDPFSQRAGTAPVIVEDHLALATSGELRLQSLAEAERTYHYPISIVEQVIGVGPLAVALNERLMVAARHDEDQHWWEGVTVRLLWTDYHVRGLLPEPPLPRREWIVELPAPPYAPAADGTRVFVADTDGRVRAYRGADGTLLWEDAAAGATAAPVLTADGLLVPAGDELVLFDAGSGEELSRIDLPAAVNTLIVTEGGTYAGTAVGRDSGSVIALR